MKTVPASKGIKKYTFFAQRVERQSRKLIHLTDQRTPKNTGDKILKNGSSKICGIQPLKNLN